MNGSTEDAELLLIAEIGVNHDGSVERASEMVEQAAGAGFDMVKFQYWLIDELLAADAPGAAYQGASGQRSLLEPLELGLDELARLREQAAGLGLGYMVTPDGRQALADVLTLKPDAIKIGSGDADNPWLLDAAASSGLRLIVSTGMMSDNEVVTSAERLRPADDVVILHCVSAYPTPLVEANLGRIDRLRQLTRRPVGFSDHTMGGAASAAAVALGAVAIEKHVTWSVTAPGPDHAASLALSDAVAWVSDLRDLALALNLALPSAQEADNRRLVRKGLYTQTEVLAGHALELEDLVPLRPLLDGVPAGDRDQVLNRKTTRDLAAGEALQLEDLA